MTRDASPGGGRQQSIEAGSQGGQSRLTVNRPGTRRGGLRGRRTTWRSGGWVACRWPARRGAPGPRAWGDRTRAEVAPEAPPRLARTGPPADQGELVVAPSSMERSVRSVPGLQSRGFADFRRGGRRGVFMAQACPKSRAPANYPRRGEVSHDARRRHGGRGAWNGGPASKSPTRPGAPTRPTSSGSWTAWPRHCNHREHRPDRPTAWIHRPFRLTVTLDGWGVHVASRPTMPETTHRRKPIAVGRSCRQFCGGSC